MAIDSGHRRLLEVQRKVADRLRVRSLNEISGRLFSILRNTPGKSVSEHQQFCGSLIGCTVEDQRRLILESYGRICLERCDPLLHQLASVAQRDND